MKWNAVVKLILLPILLLSFKARAVSKSNSSSLDSAKVTYIQGDEVVGSYANSIVIEGHSETLLVDTQRTISNAKRVVDHIKRLNKPLKAVFITHAHPDHFLGAAVIKESFPTARFLATREVVEAIKLRGELMRQFVAGSLKQLGQETDAVASVLIPEAIEGKIIPFEKMKVQVIPSAPAETEASAMLLLPELQILITGDLVYNNTHLWLNEGRFDGWIRELQQIKDIKQAETLFPGHGEKSGRAVLDENIDYIKNYKKTLSESKTVAAAVEKMKHLYPKYRMERFLTGGLEKNFEAAAKSGGN
jgi:glyoxylase-like metal-dependent hydrolase (beta-lactamase superfamily II)